MTPLSLRILLATSICCSAFWLIYEMAWIPYEYDLESAAIERQLGIRNEALRQRFANLPADRWEAAVVQLNRTSDELHTLVAEADPDWPALFSRIRSDGTDGMFADGAESLGALLLPDDRSILQVEMFYLDEDDSFDAAFWLFLLTALVVSALLLRGVLRQHEGRIRDLVGAVAAFQDENRRTPIAVRTGDPLGDLERRVDSLIGHLDRAIGDLHESIGAQRDLMHAVAHEFRGPIARLRFATDLLGESDDDAERSQLLASMDSAVEELDELVREVLGYSRIRDGGYRLTIDSIALTDVVDAVVRKASGEYPTIEFSVEHRQPESRVEVDSKMLERALINLARNAGRFAQQQVRITTQADDERFEVRVSDDGPGVPPGKRRRIFEPFTRLDASRTRESGGSGLGLAIAMAISQQHGGKVTCTDGALGGADFVLAWPSTHSAEHVER